MSSRFVPAGTDQGSPTESNDWEKARQEVDARRDARPVEPGKQEGGKSLYETLQANKAAKQDAFEEAAKLRNQFRALDDSEVDFLESVRQSERVKERSVKQETAEQLELFRKQRLAAEQAAAELESKSVTPASASTKDSWTTTKKRRRENTNQDEPTNKLQKSSIDKQSEACAATKLNTEKTSLPSSSASKPSTSSTFTKSEKIDKPGPSGLGLSAYDSDDD